MTPRQRVIRTLEFRRPDRAPRDLWAIPWIGLYAPQELAAMKERFPPDFYDVGTLGGALGVGDRERGERARKGVYVDPWGCAFHAGEDGVIGEVKDPPLAEWSALDAYRLPWEIIDRTDFDAVGRAVEGNLAGDELFFKVNSSVRPFERMQFLRGSENLYLDLGYESAELLRLRDRVHEFFLAELSRWATTGADAIMMQDDWGGQKSLLISPDQWRRLFKPLYRQYCDIIHAAGMKVFFHCDGYIVDIYEDLIEVGMDAINSQLFCMDIEEIGRRFKGRATFWGEIDRQWILRAGSVADVRAAVARVRKALDDGSGGVIAQCSWGKNNPAENIAAVYEAWDTPLDQLLSECGLE